MRSGWPHIRPRLGSLIGLLAFLGSAGAQAGVAPLRAWVSDPVLPGLQLREMPVDRVAIPAQGEPWLLYDPSTKFQEIEGFGAALTDSSLIALGSLPAGKRARLLRELFHPRHGLNISYLRVPVGASDFGTAAYTYLDLPPGAEDPELKKFDLRRALPAIQMIRQIRAINPGLRVMLSPWSPPAWMKTGGQLNGGSLKPEYYPAYARYLLKVLRGYADRGVAVDAITIQNEPYFANDKYPSMEMPAPQQIEFLRDHFIPLLEKSGLRTRVLALDHNYDLRGEAESIYSALGGRLAGIAYHCYGGNYGDLAGSTAPLYQTECSGGEWGTPAETFHFWLQSQVIGAGALGNRLSLGWNLALDENHGPFIGYCENCRGLVDINTRTKKVTFNPELIALSHSGKFLARGATRISTPPPIDAGYSTIAYRNPDGTVVQVTENSGPVARTFVVPTPSGDFFRIEIPRGGAASVVIPPVIQ